MNSRVQDLSAFAALLVLTLHVSCGPTDHTTNSSAQVQNASIPSVMVTRVKVAALDRRITLPGTVRAYQEATLYAKVAGYLKWIAVDRGDRVKAGQVLAEIEIPEMQAEIGKLRAELNVAEIERTRLTQAAARAPDLVTPQAVDSASAKSEVALADLKRAETLLEYGKLTAPFSGIVAKRWVDPGAFIPAATSSTSAKSAAVLTLMDFSIVRIEVAMPQTEVPLVTVGLPVSVSVRELPGRSFVGRVTRIAYALDESTKTMATEIEMPNPGGTLRPGMYASVTTSLERNPDALLLPSEALVTENGKPFVFTVEGGKAHKTAVQTGLDDGVSVEVKSGLASNDLVVVSPGQSLADGQPCRPAEAR